MAARGWGPPLGQTPPFCAVPAPTLALPSQSAPPSRLRSRGADIAAAARSCVGRSPAGPSRGLSGGSRPRAVRGRGRAGGMAGGRGAPAGPG